MKYIYKASLKEPRTPRFLRLLQQVGDETGYVCGICTILEMEPLLTLCGHFVNILKLDTATSTIFARLWSANLSFLMVQRLLTI